MEPRKMMGFDSPGDQKVPVSVRDWDAMRRAVWRSAVAWEITAKQAVTILEHCEHVEGCPGIESEEEPCLANRYESRGADETAVLVAKGCPHREFRMSALVVLNAARQFAPKNAKRPADQPYFAPSREYFSEVLSSLAAAEIEIERLRDELRRYTSTATASPTEPAPALEESDASRTGT